MLLSVCFLRIEDRRFVDRQSVSGGIEGLIETALVTGVAGPSDLLDFEKESVAVAINRPADDFLGVAAGFTFDPEFLPAAAPVIHEPGLERCLEGRFVHPCHHQDAMRFGVLDDGGNEAVRGQFELRQRGQGASAELNGGGFGLGAHDGEMKRNKKPGDSREIVGLEDRRSSGGELPRLDGGAARSERPPMVLLR